MAVVTPVFLDTSVLLGGVIELGPSVASAQRIMNAIAEHSVRRPLTAWHCCLEFYSVSTRLPDEVRLQPADALALVKQEILGRFSVHQLPPKQWTPFLEAAAHDGIVGGRLYDAHIAEVARLARAKVVVTDNRRHFARRLRHGIRVLGSEEFVRELL